MQTINTFIFDLDGTIIDSSKEVIKCLKKAFETVDCKVSEDKFQKILIGPPLKEIIKSIIPEIKDADFHNKIIDEFRNLYDNTEDDISTIYNNIYDVLKECKSKNKRMYIATFKPLKPTLRILKQYKIDFFDDVLCIDKFEKNITKTEMIAKILQNDANKSNSTIMIGDSISDIMAAKDNNIKSGAALWGYGNSDLISKEADYVFSECSDIYKII